MPLQKSNLCTLEQQGPDLIDLQQPLEGMTFQIFTANESFIYNFRPFGPSHGLEDGPVVHWLGPGHLGEVWKLNHWLSHDHFALPTKFQFSRASSWPRGGACGTPTWSWPPLTCLVTSSLTLLWSTCHTNKSSCPCVTVLALFWQRPKIQLQGWNQPSSSALHFRGGDIVFF